MAFSPIGVAALSSPSMFAEKFIIIWPAAGWSFGTSGKIREKNGPMMRETAWTAPAFSATERNPSHSVMTPASGNAMSITAIFEDVKVPSTTVLKTSALPV